MATMLHSESRRLYSWWWDSHISPKNSKWLQENLTDMDAKVKAMIKLIEEDADSFARRAEMYYKKRPELMKLVEEFYRAYRALAERYDHLTGELRQAHGTMAEAFPNQVPFVLDKDSPSRTSECDTEPHTPDVSHPFRALPGVSDAGTMKRGLKQLYEVFGAAEGRLRKTLNDEAEGQSSHAEVLQLSSETESLKAKAHSESERAVKAESEVQNLKTALDDMKTEKDSVFLQYQLCLEKLSNLEAELIHAQKDSERLNDQAIQAETEVQTLKEALSRVEVEKDAALVKHKKSVEKISNLEGMVSHTQEDLEGLNKRAIKAENEAQYLNLEISRLESEKEAGFQKYKDCLEKISFWEKKISLAEEDSRLVKDQADQADIEVKRLRKALAQLNKEKDSSALQYQHCLKRISELENEISCAQEDVKRLNTEILTGAMKLKHSEEKCNLLEMSNQSLRLEAENLIEKIAVKDQALLEKQAELEKLQVCVQDEHLRYAQIEAMLQTLQTIYSQSQEEHKALAQDLKTDLQMLKDLEVCKHDLEDEIRLVKDENCSLSEHKLSSTISIENLQNEILCLRKMKERLEEDVAQQTGQSNSLQKEISSLKEEMKGLNNRYQALMDQLEAVGLNPECIGSSVRNLQDENLRLRQICEMERMEKGALSKKIENMEELSKEKHVFESSLSELNSELEASREKVREMRETCQFRHGEKSVLISEKAALLSQLQGLTQNMQTLLEKNAVLENSLSGAKIELEGLREKSKGLEEICQLLKNEKSNLQTERGTLVLQLVNVECRLEYLEKRFTGLEEKCTHLEKEKESMHSEVKKLRISLDVAKQERTSSTLQSETRLVSLEHHLHLLEEENRSRKKEFNDELDKAVKAQCEIFILQKFVQDMEQKNHSLLIECQKHVEASKLAEKLISDLERENLEQEVEAELLLDEIEKLRLGIYRVFKALDASDTVFEDKVENEQTFVHQILVNIEDMKHSLLKYKDDEHLLLVENSVLLTLLRQLKLEHTEIESKTGFLEQELNATSDKLVTMQNDKYGLLEMNRLFESQVSDRNKKVMILEEEMQNLFVKQSEMEKAYLDLQEKYSEVLDENRYLLSKFSELKEEKCMLELESDFTLQESLALSTFSTFLESYGTEKSLEQKLLFEDVENLSGLMDGLKKEVGLLRGKLEKKEAENVFLKDSVQRLEMELNVVRQSNVDLNQEIESVKDVLIQREAEILEAEHKFKAAENLNMEFCKIVDVLKAENQESSHTRQNLERHLLNLSEDNGMQEKEIEGLRQTNENLVFELCKLHEESEEQRIKEEKLSSELKLKNHEFELWEAEAAAFYFDLQISSIHGVLYENKVHELTEVCESLESDSTSKTLVIEEMKGTISFMENEIGRLKAQLTAYGPIIASLRDGVTSLEHNVLSQTKLTVADFVEPKCNESGVDQFESFHDKPIYDQSPMPVGGIQDLRKLQSRIKAVEKFMVEEMKSLNAHATQETAVHAMEGLKPQRSFSQEKVKQKQKKVSGRNLSGSLRLQEDEEEGIVFKKRALMKDIPLDHISDSSLHGLRRRANVRTHRRDDQMLGLWETADCHSLDRSLSVFQNPEFAATEVYDQSKNLRQKAEHPSTGSEVEKELGIDKLELSTNTAETNQEVNDRKILERLASDAQKLTRLHLTVQNLRRKLDTNKQSRKAKDVDLETVKEQLQEIQETVVQLGDLNGQLMKNIEENPSCSNGKASAELKEAENVRRKKVSEQALKGSEKIARLQLEVQKLQYVLLKLEDEKKNKGKTRFSRSKTTIILRDFIYSGRKISGKRNKSHLCGCFRPTTPISNSPRI